MIDKCSPNPIRCRQSHGNSCDRNCHAMKVIGHGNDPQSSAFVPISWPNFCSHSCFTSSVSSSLNLPVSGWHTSSNRFWQPSKSSATRNGNLNIVKPSLCWILTQRITKRLLKTKSQIPIILWSFSTFLSPDTATVNSVLVMSTPPIDIHAGGKPGHDLSFKPRKDRRRSANLITHQQVRQVRCDLLFFLPLQNSYRKCNYYLFHSWFIQ